MSSKFEITWTPLFTYSNYLSYRKIDNYFCELKFDKFILKMTTIKFIEKSVSEYREFFFVNGLHTNGLYLENFIYEKLLEFGFYEPDLEKHRGMLGMNNLNLL